MPNYADNEVTITGDEATLKEILDKAQQGGVQWSFNNLVPMPTEFPEVQEGLLTESFLSSLQGDREATYDNAYDWAVANWGTKWDVTNTSSVMFGLGYSEEELCVSYSSAWSPATNFWKTVSELYPTVTIQQRYWEEGMGYIGESFIKDGEVEDYCIDITKEMYVKAGAVLDAEGEIDWDESVIDLVTLYPLNRL